LQKRIDDLNETRDAPDSPELHAALRKALKDRSCHVVAPAADQLARRRVTAALPELLAAFQRFQGRPVKTDPGCVAKLACLRAMDVLGHCDPGVYIAAARLVQLEPAWGPPVDTAAAVRARAALALGCLTAPDGLLVLAELLADPAEAVRRAAIDAVGQHGEGGAALLALRVRIPDPEQPVADGEALIALIRLRPDYAIPLFAPELTGDDPARREAVSWALSACREPEALVALVFALDGLVLARDRAPIAAAIAGTRSAAGWEATLALLREGRDVAVIRETLEARRLTDEERADLAEVLK